MVNIEEPMAWRHETWLRRNGSLRRPLSRDTLTPKEFEQQRSNAVSYTVYEWVHGTWSDGQGGRGHWRRL
jgi:hypothetical protein